MSKYQDPHFNKDAYWEFRRNGTDEQRKFLRVISNPRGYGFMGRTVNITRKPVTKKAFLKAFLKNTRRARRYNAGLAS